MSKKLFVGALLALGALAAAGCFPQEDSCNIKTPGIYPQFEVVEEGDAATARAVFWTGDGPNGTSLVLGSCGDAIAVNGVTLQGNNSNPVEYSATLDLATTYDFVFSRPDEGDYTSTVTDLRPEVIVLGPDGEEIPRDQEFDVTWEDNDGGDIDLLISGECFTDYPETLGDAVPDTGSYTVPANGIEAWSGDESESCTAEVTLSRTVTGDLDPVFEGQGEIYGRTMDRTTFTSTPAATY